MKKKLCLTIAAVLMIMTVLTGCGKSSSPESEVISTIDSFFGAVRSAEYVEAANYTTADEDILHVLETLWNIGNWKETILSSVGFDANDLDGSITAPIDKMIKTLQGNLIKSYKIGDINVSEGSASARVTISFGFDPSRLDNIDIGGALSDITASYLEDNFLDALYRIATDNDMSIATEMLPDFINEVTTTLSDALLSSGECSESITLKLTQQDGRWLISGIDPFA